MCCCLFLCFSSEFSPGGDAMGILNGLILGGEVINILYETTSFEHGH